MHCKRCGARLQQGIYVCPECGARQRPGASTVRCAACHGKAPIELTVCPHCGRDLLPAGPRWGLWLAGIAILAMVGLWAAGRLPVDDIRNLVVDARGNVEGLVQILDAVSLTPDMENLVAELGDSTPEFMADLPSTPTPTPTPTATPTATEIVASVAISETAPLIEEGTAPVTATLTVELTLTPEEGEFYVVKAGDSLLGIATSLNVAWQDIAAANSLSGNSVLKIGQRLRIPAPTATPEPSPTPEPTGTAAPSESPSPTASPSKGMTATATPRANARTATPAATATSAPTTPTATAPPSGGQTLYRVRSGDTLSSIGERFGVPWQDIAAANGLGASTALQVGQELVIPIAGLPPTMTPTRRPAATATPTPTTRPAATQLPAPQLRDPSDRTPYQGEGAMIVLNWFPVPGMTTEARYQVTIRWTEAGAPQEWQGPPITATEVRLPPWLFSRADQPDRRYTWFVTVVQPTTDGQGGVVNLPLSAPSTARTLTWN